MHPSVVPVAQIIQLNTGLLEKALGGLEHEALVKPALPQTNPIVWIAGHLTTARFGLAALLGETRTFALAPLFAKGARLPAEADLPPIDDVLAAWREISVVVAERLEAATEAQLAARSPKRFPTADRSILTAITFLTYHEGYHLGQLALLRKTLGLPGLVDA